AAQIAGPVAGSLLRESELALTVERETLAQIGAVMGSALDLGEAWPEFAELLSGLLPFHHISLVSIDMGSSMVRVEQDWWNSESEVLGRIPGDLFPLSGTIAENLVSTGQGDFFSFENPEQWERDYPGSQSADVANPMRSALGVPLIWGGHVVAALFIHSFEPEAFTQRELRLAERVAAQIAGPVAGSLLRTREVELVAERETLARIGSVMGSALDLGNAWNEFTDLLAKIVEFDRAQLISIATETRIATLLYDRSRTGHLPGVRKVGDSYELEGTIIGHVVETQRSLLLDGENSEELHVRFPGGFQHPTKMPWKSNLAVPLIWGGQVVAVLGVRHHDPMKYDDADQAKLERVAAQIAGPVAGALLRERDEALVRERVMLTGIGELMGGAPDLGSVFEEFTKQILKLVPFDEMAFLEIDHDRQVVKREHIFQDKRASRSRRLDPSEFSLAGTWVEKVSTSRQGLLRRSGSSEKTDKELPPSLPPTPGPNAGPRSGVLVPLIWGDEVTAAFWLKRDGENMFTEHDLALAERIAAQIAGPVVGWTARQRVVELAEERRKREAAELRAEALAEISETKSNFVSAVSHELRTPLTSIIAFADILNRRGDKELDERPLQQVKVIQRNARRLEGLINELLDLSTMESGQFEIVRSTFDFASMIAESLESSELQFEALSQTVKLKMVTEVLPINGDRERLLQVVSILLNNASKYSPNGTEIEIEITADEEALTVEVRDRGPGIPDDRPEELFEMFHRADDELTRRVPGTGIGLHIAKRIIDEHGGEITIAPREGGGATARFWIPTGVNAQV
ncbi:MAG: GAF domain-containing protein, partial [Chloroflexi bacterium]|nr:GAF domain-containing protein [Chloroflexota bacterium]